MPAVPVPVMSATIVELETGLSVLEKSSDSVALAPVEQEKIVEEKNVVPVVEPVNKNVVHHQIKQGETLAKIAAKAKPERASLDQMLVAVYRSNPEALVTSKPQFLN